MVASRFRRTARLGLAAAAAIASLSLTGSALAAPAGAPSQGAFVIGDQSAQVGAHVTFWGAQWWKRNDLSGGDAPPSFKGWAHVADLSCLDPWTTRPGNSSFPPAAVDDLVTVLVASEVDKSGRVISGNAVDTALIAVDPGYAGNPGHPGTGTIVDVWGCGWSDTF